MVGFKTAFFSFRLRTSPSSGKGKQEGLLRPKRVKYRSTAPHRNLQSCAVPKRQTQKTLLPHHQSYETNFRNQIQINWLTEWVRVLSMHVRMCCGEVWKSVQSAGVSSFFPPHGLQARLTPPGLVASTLPCHTILPAQVKTCCVNNKLFRLQYFFPSFRFVITPHALILCPLVRTTGVDY